MAGHQTEKQVVTTILGTTVGTILAATPPQMSVDIYSVRYAYPLSGTTTAYLLQTPVNTGYSPSGTVSGTIDAVTLDSSLPTYGDTLDDGIVTKVSPGFTLAGVVTSGSVIARITYQYRYGRN